MVIPGRLHQKSKPKRKTETVRAYRIGTQCYLMETEAKRRISKGEGGIGVGK